MPVLSRPTRELNTHIFLPVIEQVIHRILATLGYADYIGDRIFVNTEWTAVSKTSDINNQPNTGTTLFKVEPNIQMNPTSQKWDCYTFHHTAAYGIGVNTLNNTFPIYHDPFNGVRIVEMRSPVTIALSCELILQSPEMAFQTPLMLFNGYENGCVFHYNDLFYDYPIPEPIMSVLYEIWRMDRLRGKDNKVPFVQYLQSNSDCKWSYHKNRERPQYELTIPVFDLKTLATLEYSDDRPQAVVKDKVAVGFSIPFQYTIQFAMPSMTILKYPVMINNQLIPPQYIPIDQTSRFNNLEETHGHIALERCRRTGEGPYRTPPGCVKFPFYDDWEVPFSSTVPKSDYAAVAIYGIMVNEEDPHLLTEEDLTQDVSDEYKLKQVVKDILINQGVGSMSLRSIYNVSLYRDDKLLMGGKDFWFDGKILKFRAINTYGHYRCVISATTNILRVGEEFRHLLLEYFVDLPQHMKMQIKSMIESGHWRERDWPKWVTLEMDGWIYDRNRNALMHIKDLRRVYNANNSATRVIAYTIQSVSSKDTAPRGTVSPSGARRAGHTG